MLNILQHNLFLSKILIISKKELTGLYRKVPFIKAFKVTDYDGETLWMTFVSCFIEDFATFYSLFNAKFEMYMVVKEQENLSFEQINEEEIVSIEQNIN